MIRLEMSTRGVLTLLATLFGLWLLARLWPVVLLVIISLMFAASLLPFVEYLVRRGTSRIVAVLVVALAMLLTIVLLGFVVVPAVIEQARAIIDRLPELRERAVSFLDGRGARDFARQVEQYQPSRLLGPGVLTSTGREALDVITTTVTILVMTIYIMFDARRIERFIYFATPQKYHEHIRNLTAAMQRVVGGYIRGQLITSGCIAVFTFVTLLVVGVPNPVALAVLAGIADMIPMVGAFLAIAPAALAALSISLPKAIIVVVVLFIYQEFENRVLVQRVYGATLRLPAVAVFLALLIGAELLGIVGALLSLPAAAGLRVLVEYGNDLRTGRIPAAAPSETLFAPDDGTPDVALAAAASASSGPGLGLNR